MIFGRKPSLPSRIEPPQPRGQTSHREIVVGADAPAVLEGGSRHLKLVGYNEPIARVVFIPGRQIRIAPLPFARVEILPQLLQSRFNIVDDLKGRTARPHARVKIGFRPSPISV